MPLPSDRGCLLSVGSEMLELFSKRVYTTNSPAWHGRQITGEMLAHPDKAADEPRDSVAPRSLEVTWYLRQARREGAK
jgi:hypothetical protein